MVDGMWALRGRLRSRSAGAGSGPGICEVRGSQCLAVPSRSRLVAGGGVLERWGVAVGCGGSAGPCGFVSHSA
jgi:hypothetical protein